MLSKWIGCIHKGQVGTRWSPRAKPYMSDPEDKSGNAEKPEDDMWSHVKFSTEPIRGDWPASVQRVRLPLATTGAR